MTTIFKIIKREEGFGFLELIIASAIMFMAALSFAGLMVSSLEFMSSTQVKTIAYNLATKTIEDLKDIDFSQVTSSPMQAIVGKDTKFHFSKVVNVQDIDSSSPPDGVIDYKKVIVTVSWTKPFASSYTATTYLNPYGMVETKNSPPSDVNPPFVHITGPQPVNGYIKDTQIIEATANDMYGVSKIEIYIDNVLMSTSNMVPVSPGTSKATFTWDTTSYIDGIYQVYAKAFDKAGNMGTAQSIGFIVVNALTGDETNPTAPTFVNARRKYTLLGAPTNKIEVVWNPATDNVGVIGYKIYRNDGTSVPPANSLEWSTSGLSFTDDIGSTTQTPRYWVKAIDGNLNKSPLSNWAEPDDIQSPSIPTSITVLKENGHEIKFQWDASVDDSSIAYYKVYGVPTPPNAADPLIVSPSAPTVAATINYPAGAHDWTFYITAVDNLGHESNKSAPIHWSSH